MTLAQLIDSLQGRVEIVARRGNMHMDVTGVADDSRAVRRGALFVAVKGERVDGHDFVQAALAAGAGAVVCERPVHTEDVPVVQVADSRAALGVLGSAFHREPSTRLRMVGVTGTNGKTTTTYVCKALLEAVGRKVGLIGTVAYQIGPDLLPAGHTTPGAVELQSLLARMAEAGMDTAVMEVSSHALALDRTAGCEFDVAVFTNLTQDHLDFHPDMEEYFQAKLRLFTGLNGIRKSGKRAIVNVDDPRGPRVISACPAPVWSYAIKHPADLKAERIKLSVDGTAFTATTPAGSVDIQSHLVGEHNVYNLLAAIGVALHEGVSIDDIKRGLGTVANVPGRFERVATGRDFTVVVDYAHTEDALLRLLAAAQALKCGRIITVFGCGGDRDRSKRPKMGRAAVLYSDVVILTSDNPRTEDPQAILREVEAGVREALRDRPGVHYRVIADRRDAIRAAVQEARAGDMVLIAGKGHEDYQIIGTTKFHFDDREVAREAVERLRSGA